MAVPEGLLQPGEAGWWLGRLEDRLNEESQLMRENDRFYSGRQPPPFLTPAHQSKLHSEFSRMLEESQANFCRMTVDVVEERMQVDGFRLSAQSDSSTDERSWNIWQANQMDAHSQTAMLEALIKGRCYLSVWSGDDYPTIAVEDPEQTIVAHRTNGMGRRVRAAALKTWRDDFTDDVHATVYMPDGIYKFSREQRSSNWDVRQPEGESWPVPNPSGVVPIVPLVNRPRLQGDGESDLTDVKPVQNQINGLLFLLALAGYFGAHRQRWAAGIKLQKDDEGNPTNPFDIAIDRLLATDSVDAKFGEFEQTDLRPYIEAIEQKIQHLAMHHGLPRHYLIQQGQSPSGDAIRSAESRLIRRCEKKQRPFGEGFEETMRVAWMFDDQGPMPVDSEVTWANPATPTIAEQTDAVIKQFQAGLITWETACEELGYSQTKINRMKRQRVDDAVNRLLAGAETADDEAPTAA